MDDPGEVEAISLALELAADLLLADDRKARTVARSRNLAVAGTVGVLELAAQRGLVKHPLYLWHIIRVFEAGCGVGCPVIIRWL